jgi:hypothetical protein
VDEFRRRLVGDQIGVRIARGQCVEGYGGKEAYYPLLEALGQLFRGSAGDSLVGIVERQAPTLLVQFPALVRPEHRETLQQEIMGATRQRMLREIGEALETIASWCSRICTGWITQPSISSLHGPPPAVGQTDANRHIPDCRPCAF